MSRLKARITGTSGPVVPAVTRVIAMAASPGTAEGIVVDGVWHGLDGQPPPAVSAGWGDLSFLYRSR